MLKGIFAEISPTSKFFIIIFIILISFILTNVIGVVFSMLLFNINFTTLSNVLKNIDIKNHANINILKFLQILQTIGLFLIPPLIAGYLFSKNTAEFLKLNKKPKASAMLLILFIIISCLPIIEWLAQINSQLILPSQLHELEMWMKQAETNAEVTTKAFLDVSTFKGLALNIFMIGIITAIGEEFLFRGLLINLFKEWTKNKHAAVIISAIIFSIIHFQFYGFIPRMLLGVLFGYLFIWSGSIWIPIFIHFLNNGIAVMTSYMQSKGIIQTETDKMFSSSNNYIFLALGIISATIFIWLFYFYSKRNVESIIMNEDSGKI